MCLAKLTSEGFSHGPHRGLAEILTLVIVTLLLRWCILAVHHFASLRDKSGRWTVFLFRHTESFPQKS